MRITTPVQVEPEIGTVLTQMRTIIRDISWAFQLLVAYLTPRSHVRARHSGDVPLAGPRVAVFVHYDANSVTHDYVLAYLDALKAAGFATIVAVNSPKLRPEALAALKPRAAMILHRANRGYDFGAYRDGVLEIAQLPGVETLLITNDSVYGPFTDLEANVFERINPQQADVWGLTDAWNFRHHLQSYFVIFTAAALGEKRFWDFWRRLLPVNSKWLTIRRYEIGLTGAMRKAGLRCQALFPYRELAGEMRDAIGADPELKGALLTEPQRKMFKAVAESIMHGSPLNPTHVFWDRLIVNHRFPFLKRELLTTNPLGMPIAGRWDLAVKTISQFDTAMIERHLQVVNRGRSP